jgi:hypothetical protein
MNFLSDEEKATIRNARREIFDKTATIKRDGFTPDGMGGQIAAPVDAGQYACSLSFSFGKDRAAAGSVIATIDAVCHVDPAYTPQDNDRLEIGGVLYQITGQRPSDLGLHIKLYLTKA